MNATVRRVLNAALTLGILLAVTVLLRLTLVGGIDLRAGFGRVKFTCNKPENPFIILVVLLAVKALVARPAPFARLGRWLRRNRKAVLLGTVITIIAGAPRLYDLGANSISTDELLWMERGRRSIEALYEREFKKATAPFGHPGVVPGVLIGASYSFLGKGSSRHSYNLIEPMAAARLPVAILGTATCLLLFLVARAYFGNALSFWAAVFLSLYPSHISLSRVAHVDSTLTLFFALSLLCYLVYAERIDLRWKISSAILWSFALLSKLPALILPVVLAVWKACLRLRDRRGRLRFLELSDLAWLGLGIGLYLSLYTRLWHAPAEVAWSAYGSRFPKAQAIGAAAGLIAAFRWYTVAAGLFLLFALLRAAETAMGGAGRGAAGMLRKAVAALLLLALCLSFLKLFERPLANHLNLGSKAYAVESHGHLKYWMGHVVSRPPPWFYPFIFVISTPPLMLFFFPCGVVLACRACVRRDEGWKGLLLCLIAPAVFTMIMSCGRKMGFRYISPVIPFVCILAAAGLMGAGELLRRAAGPGRSPGMLRAMRAILAAAIIASLAAPLLNIFPAYDLYFNILIGGAAGAARVVSIGWGEGSKEAVAFIKARAAEDDAIYVVGLSAEARFSWDHDGAPGPRGVTINQARPPHVDWIVIPLNHRLKRLDMQTIRLAETVPKAHAVTMCGVDLMDIYHLADAPRMEKHTYSLSDLKIADGNVVADPGASGRIAVRGRAGAPRELLIHGPYVRYAPGRWKAVFRVKRASAAGGAPVARLSVTGVSQGDTLSSVEVDGGGTWVYEEIPLEFTIDRPRRLQFCVLSYGVCDFWADGISLYKLQDDSRQASLL